MALIPVYIFSIILCSVSILHAQNPFPEGYFMAGQGTIFQDNWISSREPYCSSLLSNDSVRMGISAGAISYYDRMDNLSNRSLYRISGGGWISFDKIRLNCSISQLEAFNIYFKQKAFLSFGMTIRKSAAVSLDIDGYREGLHSSMENRRTRGDLGIAALFRFRAILTTASLSNLTFKKPGTQMNTNDLTASLGLHTKYGRIGAQGAVLSIMPYTHSPVQLILGEEFRITERIGMNASFSSNPFFIGFGFFAGFKNSDMTVGLVNHPDLGWSRGFSIAHCR